MTSSSAKISFQDDQFEKIRQALPEDICMSFDILFQYLQKYTFQASEDKSQALGQVTLEFSKLLAKCIEINRVKQNARLQQEDSHINLLKNIMLFRNLEDHALAQILTQIEEMSVPAQTYLLTQNAPANAVYFLEKGSVDVSVNDELVAHLEEGTSFGEMSCLRGETFASASVKTTESSLVLRIERENFMDIVNHSPQLWQKVFHDMSGRFKETNGRLSEVLQHNPQGLLKVDKNGKVTNEFSFACTKYFGHQQLNGLDFSTLMFPTEPNKQTDWRDVFPLFFEDIPMDFKQLAEILPKETHLRVNDQQQRQFQLSYYACLDSTRSNVAVDVGMEDITQAKELSKKKDLLELERMIFQKMYDNPDLFLNMLELSRETTRQVTQFETLIKARPFAVKEDKFIEIMRYLHSLKGSSGMFSIGNLQDASHRLEDLIRTLQAQGDVNESGLQQFQILKNELLSSAAYAQGLVDNMSLELRRRLTGMIVLPGEFEQLKTVCGKKDLIGLQRLIKKLEKVSVNKWSHSWSRELQRLSRILDKKVELHIDGEETMIPQDIFEKMDAPLLHLLRNSIDHGIETPQERLAEEKDETGKVKVEFSIEDKLFKIVISDDGKGLNFENILQKALKNTLINQQEVKQYQENGELWRIMFMPGFSTAAQVTEISGRGVGLDVVRSTIESLNGNYAVESQVNKGTLFRFTLPLNEE